MSERNEIKTKAISIADFIAYKIIDGKKDIVFKMKGCYKYKEQIKKEISEKLKSIFVYYDGIDVVLNAND